MIPRPGYADEPDDAAVHALVVLVATLEDVIARLSTAADHAAPMIDQRVIGTPWSTIAAGEQRPTITGTLTEVLEELGDAGNRFRREVATALRNEGMSTRAIGEVLGVSRQRAHTLLQQSAVPAGARHDRPGP